MYKNVIFDREAKRLRDKGLGTRPWWSSWDPWNWDLNEKPIGHRPAGVDCSALQKSGPESKKALVPVA